MHFPKTKKASNHGLTHIHMKKNPLPKPLSDLRDIAEKLLTPLQKAQLGKLGFRY
jgi:hypothetical protein